MDLLSVKGSLRLLASLFFRILFGSGILAIESASTMSTSSMEPVSSQDLGHSTSVSNMIFKYLYLNIERKLVPLPPMPAASKLTGGVWGSITCRNG